MTDAPVNNEQRAPTDSPQDRPKAGVDWADPNVPVGEAPPMPNWPLALFAIMWVGWIAFLAAMAISRIQPATV